MRFPSKELAFGVSSSFVNEDHKKFIGIWVQNMVGTKFDWPYSPHTQSQNSNRVFSRWTV